MNLTPEHLRIINAGLLKFPVELRHDVAAFIFAGLAKLDVITETAVHSRIGVAQHQFAERSREVVREAQEWGRKRLDNPTGR